MNKGMSIEMYNFIKDNIHRITILEDEGKILTVKGTNGTVCSSTGYLRVKVNNKTLQVHQIMAYYYFGELCIGKQVNHKDCNKLNNKKCNLEVVTNVENLKHQRENGLSSAPDNRRKVDKLSLSGDYICTYNSLTEACKENSIGITQSIRNAIKGRNQDGTKCSQAGGFKWRYTD